MFNFLFEFIRIQIMSTEYVSSQIRYMYKFKEKPRDFIDQNIAVAS